MKASELCGIALVIAAVGGLFYGASWMVAGMFAMLPKVYIVTGGWTFSFLLLVTALIVIGSYLEKSFSAGYGSLLLFLVVMQLFGTTTPIAWLTHYWWVVLLGAPAFLVGGFFWSKHKFAQKVRETKAAKEAHREAWFSSRGLPLNGEIPPELQDAWSEDERWNKSRFAKPTLATEHRLVLIEWSYWPVSLGIDICKNYLRELYEELIRRTSHFYQRTADKIWEDAS